MKHKWILILVLLCSVFSIEAPRPSMAQQPIRIGASIAISGRDAVQGGYVREGYLLCQKHVNEKGGLLGHQLEFVIRDDGSDPKGAAALYETLITGDKVDGVMGPYGSAMTEAVADVTEKHRKLMVAPAAGTSSIWEKGRRYLIMVLSPLEAATEGTIDLAARNGLKTIALINVDTLPAKAVAKGAIELAKKKGLEVVLHETYPAGTTDFSAILNKLKAAKPDALVANYVPAEVVAITRQMRQLDVNVKMLGATPGASFVDYYKGLEKTAEFVYAGSYWDPSLAYPGNREFVAAYRKEFNHDPSFLSPASYAGCQLFVEAVRRAGSLDSDKLRQELLKTKTRTVFGDFAVDDRGFQIGHKAITIQWQDSKQVVVWPDEVATGKPRFPMPAWTGR
ncbi:MAG TPA: amino acid ABC transporter substrate-binding protein [Candidatus Binatia bacterium]|nr:amino acid ABC transporter substrate-binding protein [Candidatus Binatia bacterium]